MNNPVGLLIRIIVMAAIVVIGSAIMRNITDALTLAVGGPVWPVTGELHPASPEEASRPMPGSRFYRTATKADR